MTISIVDSGSVTRTVTAMKAMDGGTLRNILRVKVMDADGTTLRTVASFADPLSVSISPAGVFGIANSAASVSVLSNSATATPAGGLAPFTYAWSVISDTNPSGTVSANSATAATSTFTMTNVPAYTTYTAVLRCTVTDAIGQTAYHEIDGEFINDGPFA